MSTDNTLSPADRATLLDVARTAGDDGAFTETEQIIQQAVAFVITEDSGSDVIHFTPVVFGDQRGLVHFQRAAVLG